MCSASRIRILIFLFVLVAVNAHGGISEKVDNYLNHKFERAHLKHFFTEVDSMRIEYWDTKDSSKTVLLLVHGFGADARIQWANLVKKLSEKYRLIIPNLPYFGASYDFTHRYTTTRQVEAIELLLRKLKVEKYAVSGISYGTLVSMYLAERNPNQVTKVVLMSTPAYGEEVINQQVLLQQLGASSYSELLIPKNRDDMRKLLSIGYYHPPKIPGKWLEQMIPSVVGTTRSEKDSLLVDLVKNRTEYIGRHKVINQPLLLFVGEFDPLTSPQIAQNLLIHYPKAKLVTVSKSAHLAMIERPRKVKKVLLPFLEN